MNIISIETGVYDLIKKTILDDLLIKFGKMPPLLGMSSYNNTGEGSQNDPELSRKLVLENKVPVLIHPVKYIDGLS